MNNKKIIIPFLLISSMAFADIEVDFIKKEKATKDYSYNITVPQFKLDGKNIENVNIALNDEISILTRKIEFEAKELKKAGSQTKAEIIVDFKEFDNNFGVTSVVSTNYSYSGGANGNTVLSSYNLDSTNGKILNFDDIFIRSAKQSFEKGILQTIKNNKIGKYMTDLERVNLDDAIMYFDRNYIVFKFQKYTIAPGSSGNPAFRYKADDIKDFIKYDFHFKK